MDFSLNSPNVSQIQSYNHSNIFDQSLGSENSTILSELEDEKTVTAVPRETSRQADEEHAVNLEEASEERRREYETVKGLNKAVQTIYQNLEVAGDKLQ